MIHLVFFYLPTKKEVIALLPVVCLIGLYYGKRMRSYYTPHGCCATRVAREPVSFVCHCIVVFITDHQKRSMPHANL